MAKLFNMFKGIVLSLGFGGFLTFAGYLIYTEQPLDWSDNRRGGLVQEAQDFLVNTFGSQVSGIGIMAIGVIGGLLWLISTIRNRGA